MSCNDGGVTELHPCHRLMSPCHAITSYRGMMTDYSSRLRLVVIGRGLAKRVPNVDNVMLKAR